jgi:tRNA-dihydrouridine synthase
MVSPGVMVGRGCINHPYMWINTDRVMYGSHQSVRSRGEIIEEYAQYCETVERKEKRFSDEENEKVPIRTLLAPVFNIFNGEDYCVKYRRELEKMSTRCLTPSIILRAAVRNIPQEVLHGRRGEYRNNDEIIVHQKTKKTTGVMKITVS